MIAALLFCWPSMKLKPLTVPTSCTAGSASTIFSTSAVNLDVTPRAAESCTWATMKK